MVDHTTVEWVCTAYPDRMAALFDSLNLEIGELREVKAAVTRGDAVGAGKALLAYYRNGRSGSWLRGPVIRRGTGRNAAADAILEDTFTFYRQTDRVPRTANGGLEWTHPGPSNDWEWTLALNRHHHLRQLLAAYRNTGNPAYAMRIDEHIRDWITASLPYPATRNATAIWRGLEISFRAKAWAQIFYALQHDDLLTPAARLLMLTSLPEHAHHLRHFHGGENWLTMELSALAMIAAAWPEFSAAGNWLDYASSTLTRELARQVYPDGAQHELTSHYHRVALSNFEQFAGICRGAGIPLADDYAAGLEAMWNYLAGTIRPNGYGLLNNDSDLDYNRDRILDAATTYERPDWAYAASNGARGRQPDTGPSAMFPWAGQLVIRSSWDANALWAFFDVGPWGTGHQHNDKLHLSVAACGRDLLVDSGRFTYAGNDVRFRRDYAVLSRAHNVILIDGRGQDPGPKQADRPIDDNDYAIAPDMTFARGVCDHFAVLEGEAVHSRAVVSIQGELIVVADRVHTDRPRTLEALWHWHPDCTVAVAGQAIVSNDDNAGNLRIVPVADFTWNATLVRGREQPHPQGWYSPRYNQWEPGTAAVLNAEVHGTAAFAWILLPAHGQVPDIHGDIAENADDALTIRIRRSGRDPMTLRIPWHSGSPLVQ